MQPSINLVLLRGYLVAAEAAARKGQPAPTVLPVDEFLPFAISPSPQDLTQLLRPLWS